MAYEQRDMSGSLFKNDRKEKPNHPDYTGTIMVGSVSFYLSAWIKKSQSGKTFMSLAVKAQDKKAETTTTTPAKGGFRVSNNDMDDEIPF